MSTVPYRCWVEVSRERLAQNYRAVCSLVGPEVTVTPVVKADAYRHGAVEVSRVLEAAGARWFAVSSVEEGVVLRNAGIRARILVMADFLPFEREALVAHHLTPAIHSLEDIAELDRFASARGHRIAYHLKIDSGMGRLGTRAAAEATATSVGASTSAYLEGLMTHFASAALADTPQTEEQIQYFQAVAAGLADRRHTAKYQHLSATIPVAYGLRSAWGNMVRPGHAIYGYVSPRRGSDVPPQLHVDPALEWKAAILEIKDIPPNAPIGYGAMFRAQEPMRVGVLAVGYADGFPHRLSNKGRIIAAGRRVPILGAVSMDLTTVDLTALPHLRAGDSVTLLGRDSGASIDAQQIARTAGTISYSVLCGISARVKRLYK